MAKKTTNTKVLGWRDWIRMELDEARGTRSDFEEKVDDIDAYISDIEEAMAQIDDSLKGLGEV